MITLTLPYPLSANRYWRPVPIGKHITIVPTKEAKQYRKDVAHLCAAAGVITPLSGRVSIEVQLYPHRPLDWQKRQRLHGDAWDAKRFPHPLGIGTASVATTDKIRARSMPSTSTLMLPSGMRTDCTMLAIVPTW